MKLRIKKPAVPPSELEDRFSRFLLPMIPSDIVGDPLLDLANTPARVTRMWQNELLKGYSRGAEEALEKKFKWFPADKAEGMVVESGVPFTSVCAHHLLPFVGTAHFGYIPHERIMGLSKVAWVLDHFAAQLQLQERLTSQVADYLQEKLDPVALILVLDASHECVSCRGPKKAGVITTTAAIRGKAWEKDVRDEFYTLIRR